MKKKKITTHTLRKMKKENQSITMVTAYDFPSAKIVEEAGAEVVLVGDSLGMVVLGYDSTVPVTIEDMVHHTKAVARGTKELLIVSDLPFLIGHLGREKVLQTAGRLLQEGGAHAVKIEGGSSVLESISTCIGAGIPVMGHLGLTPQSVHLLGGYRVQGKDPQSAKKLIEEAKKLEEIGVFALVLECIPEELAKLIQQQLNIPTIGIGAGPHCDGQVLVYHDLLGYGNDAVPSFVKTYASLKETAVSGVQQFVKDVKNKKFPVEKEHFYLSEQTIQTLYGSIQ